MANGGWDTTGVGDPWESKEDKAAREQTELRDRQLGTVIRLLDSRDQSAAVGYLLGCEKIELVYNDHWNNSGQFDIALYVQIDQFDNFSDEAVHGEIVNAYDVVLRPFHEGAGGVVLQPTLVEPNWREARARSQEPKVTNQAVLAPLPPQHPQEDRLHFRDKAELFLYREFKAIQLKLPKHDTIGIAPNCAIRVNGYTWEPDFIITYRGRAGVVEVDGRSHQHRWAADESRDSMLENAGMMIVRRIQVEHAELESEAKEFVRAFMGQLSRPR